MKKRPGIRTIPHKTFRIHYYNYTQQSIVERTLAKWILKNANSYAKITDLFAAANNYHSVLSGRKDIAIIQLLTHTYKYSPKDPDNRIPTSFKLILKNKHRQHWTICIFGEDIPQ